MANRYWRNVSANWDTTNTNQWSSTDGGSVDGSAPTTADNVYFTTSSGTGIVTVTGSASCADLNCTGFAGTLTGSGSGINFYGDVKLVSGMTLAGSISFTCRANATLTSSGKSLYSINSLGAVLTCNDALTSSILIARSDASMLLKSGVTTTITSNVVDATTSVGNFTLGATTTSAATLSVASGAVNIRYATISYSTATGGATFTAGPGATDGGNNTGWTFISSGTPLFELGAF